MQSQTLQRKKAYKIHRKRNGIFINRMSCHVMLKITGGNGLQNPKIHRKKDFYRQLYKLQLLVVLSFF